MERLTKKIEHPTTKAIGYELNVLNGDVALKLGKYEDLEEVLLKELEEMKASAEEYCKICKDAINREQYSYYYGRETAFAAVVNLIKGYIAATAIDMINNGEIIIGEDYNEEN